MHARTDDVNTVVCTYVHDCKLNIIQLKINY